MKNNLKLTIGLLMAGIFSLLVGDVTGISSIGIFLTITALSAFTKREDLALFTAIDTTELTSALGDYYRENRDIMISKLLLDPSMSDKFAVYDDVTDELPLPNLAVSDIIKPGVVKTFAPSTSVLDFGARMLKVRDIKYDLFIVPTDLHKKWLAYNRTNRRTDGSHDPWEIPFEEFILNYIMASAREQLYLKGIFNGSYNAAGTTPASTMTGFSTLVTELITATTLTPVSVANPTADNIIDVVEAVHDGLAESYKNSPTQMFANPTLFNYYVRKYRSLHGSNNDYEGMKNGRVLIDGTSCELVREAGLGASNRLLCGPKDVFAYGCDTSATATMDIQKFDRGLKILGDFKAGVQFTQVGNGALSVNGLI